MFQFVGFLVRFWTLLQISKVKQKLKIDAIFMITDHLSMPVEQRLETSVDQRMISLRELRFNESCLFQAYLGYIGLSGLHFIQSLIWCDNTAFYWMVSLTRNWLACVQKVTWHQRPLGVLRHPVTKIPYLLNCMFALCLKKHVHHY
jgi:hypothetical protein